MAGLYWLPWPQHRSEVAPDLQELITSSETQTRKYYRVSCALTERSIKGDPSTAEGSTTISSRSGGFLKHNNFDPGFDVYV